MLYSNNLILILFFTIFTYGVRDYPKIALFFTSESFSYENIEEKLSIIVDSLYVEMEEICDGHTNETIKNDCIAYNNSIIGYYVSEGININQKLRTIPKKIDLLYFFTDGISTPFDFNYLRSHTVVSINPFDYTVLEEFNYLKKMIKERKMNSYKPSINLSTKENTVEVSIVGDMNKTVTFLTLSGINVNFEGDVNCQNLFLNEVQIQTANNNVFENVDYLILSRRTIEFNPNINFDRAKQITYYDDHFDSSSITIYITSDEITLTTNNYPTYNSISSFTKEIGYIFKVNSIDVELTFSDDTTQDIVNLTFLNLDSLDNLPTYEVKETQEILTMTSNDPSTIQRKILTGTLPYFVINYDFDRVTTDKTNFQFDCEEKQLYVLIPKGDIDEDEELSPTPDSIETTINNDNPIHSSDNNDDPIHSSDNNNDDPIRSSDNDENDQRLDRSYSYSITFSVTYFKLRSVSYSYAYSYSNLYFNNSFGFEISNSISLYFLPYIIYYLSPSYIPFFIKIPIKRKLISQEQLIGITCGSAAVFFFILFIIIRLMKKKIKDNNYYYSIFLDNNDIDEQIKDEIISKENNQMNDNVEVKENSSSEEYDIDFWLI